ncbi:MAG: GTPase HflX [Spirochaetales bacterium]|nr:GTPase HflX [Spirochaetales bacterium]
MNHVIGYERSEKAYLVGIKIHGNRDPFNIEDSLGELQQLARTSGVEVVGRTYQHLRQPHPATYIGSGKVAEIREAVLERDAETVIFDDELNPGQQKNLEAMLGGDIKVIDRTALILDIFARHAASREGQIQVELAQYEYRLPRLTRLWTHLIRQAGGRAGGEAGGVGLRGPGETQLETDRRLIQKKIASLKKELEEVRLHRRQHRMRRKKRELSVIALVGYTNAGKSSLLNALSTAEVKVEDKLFATLDPTTRRLRLPGGRIVLVTDTVGFIKKLPHHLVAAFRATLEGIAEADLLLQVADISHPTAKAQLAVTEDVLREQGVSDKPKLIVWNKIDRLDGRGTGAHTDYSGLLAVSARTGEGLDRLLIRIEEVLNRELIEVRAEIPYSEGALLHDVYTSGYVHHKTYGPNGTLIAALVPVLMAARLVPYRIGSEAGV